MKRRILTQKIGYMVILFPLIEPNIIEHIRLLDLVFNVWKLFSFFWVFILYFGKYRKIDKYILTFLSCYFIGLISTVFHEGWIYGSLVQLINLTAMVLLIKMMLNEDPMLCFDVVLPLLEILLYVNLASIILFPDGMYSEVTEYYEQTENWLLGLDNAQAPYYVAGIAITVIRDYYRTGELKISLRSWVLISVCIMTVCLRWQATIVVGMMIILPVILMPRLFIRSRVLNIMTYMVTVALLFFGIVIFRTQDYFAFFIQGVLHKNLTFSKRTYIWDYAIEAIKKKPLLGFGVLSMEQAWDLIHQSHAHSIFLQMLLLGGIIGLSLFLYMHAVIVIKLMKNRHNGIVCFLSVIIFSMLIMNQMENYQSCLWFLVYTLAFNSDRIIMRQREYQTIKSEKSN